jgi:two-component SAPR family response regulator
MKNFILCSSNPILVKSLYGILRDEGHRVEMIEHPAFAVQLVLNEYIDCVIIDSEPFGLPAEDAVAIIKTIAPRIQVLFLGRHDNQSDEAPLDLEALKKTIHSMAV